jgi:hypothetical protein
VPANIELAMGMTCTINIGDRKKNLRQDVLDVTTGAIAQLAALRDSYFTPAQAQPLAK